MNQVSSFLENIIAVEESDPVASSSARPPSTSDRSRRSTQDSDCNSVSERSDLGKDASVTESERLSTAAVDPIDPLVSSQGPVSDFWYLEDDQKKVSNQLTDRLIEKVLSVMLSTEMKPVSAQDPRTFVSKTRPPLSMHLMSINTTQIVQKTSPVFEVLDEMAFSIGWYNPWHTLGVALLATLLVLKPYLLTVVPSSVLLKRFLVPGFLKLYPPDPSVLDHAFIHQNPLVHEGPALAKWEAPKQVSQFSREFVMNFTDLQNHMVLYIRAYDALVAWGQHYFLFENQQLSSVVFLGLVGSIVFNVTVLPWLIPIFLTIVPVKALLLLALWSATALSHPVIRRKALDTFVTEDARVARRDRIDRVESALMRTVADEEHLLHPLTKEAEVFELHALNASKIWEPIGFTNEFYALNHPKRHLNELKADVDSPELRPVPSSESTESAGDRTGASIIDDSTGAIFRKATLSEIKPPKHWRFAEKHWQIDLDPLRWVNATYIMDLVNVDDEEKWVYDFVVNDDSRDASGDGQIFRRRRWVRQCVRETESQKESGDVFSGGTSSERLSKTFSTLLS